MMQTNLLNRTEAAKYLGIKPQTLSVWASNKRYPLRYIKIGRSVRYLLSDIESFVHLRTVITE